MSRRIHVLRLKPGYQVGNRATGETARQNLMHVGRTTHALQAGKIQTWSDCFYPSYAWRRHR